MLGLSPLSPLYLLTVLLMLLKIKGHHLHDLSSRVSVPVFTNNITVKASNSTKSMGINGVLRNYLSLIETQNEKKIHRGVCG